MLLLVVFINLLDCVGERGFKTFVVNSVTFVPGKWWGLLLVMVVVIWCKQIWGDN